jgi:hypothetical protein
MISCRQAILIVFAVFGVLSLVEYREILQLSEEIEAQGREIEELKGLHEKALEGISRLERELDLTREELRRTDIALREAEETVEELNLSLVKAGELVEELNYSISLHTHIVAIRSGKGVILPLETEVKTGEGRLLIDTADVLFEEDVQRTMKTAYGVAQDVTGEDFNRTDVIFHISNPFKKTVIVSGGSCGAIMALSLIALTTDREIREGILVTGGLDRKGNIVDVYYVRQKATAAREANATTLLVPDGQKITLEGIDIVEVSDIYEVMDLMLE